MNKIQKNSFPLFESVKTVITETQQYVVGDSGNSVQSFSDQSVHFNFARQQP